MILMIQVMVKEKLEEECIKNNYCGIFSCFFFYNHNTVGSLFFLSLATTANNTLIIRYNNPQVCTMYVPPQHKCSYLCICSAKILSKNLVSIQLMWYGILL